MNKQLDEIISLLQGITNQLSSIEENLNRLGSNTPLTEKSDNRVKIDEHHGFVRGAEYYANLDKRSNNH